MKNFKNLIVLGLTLTSLSGWAQSADETSREISAQTTITRGHIDNVLQRISRQRPDSAFRANDFWPQSKDYKAKVEAALTQFEDKLEKDILAKAAYWMDQYNSVYVSLDYSREQKAVLLKQREEFLRNQFVLLSQDYQKALAEVYSLVPQYDLRTEIVFPEPNLKIEIIGGATKKVPVLLKTNKGIEIKSTFSVILENDPNSWADDIYIAPKNTENDSSKWEKREYGEVKGIATDRKKRIGDDTMLYVFDFNKVNKYKELNFPDLEDSAYQKLLYPTIKGTCQSSICLGLRAGEFSTLLGSVKTLIDRDMTLTLASGVKLEIKSLNHNIKMISSMLNSVAYPETLPFDI